MKTKTSASKTTLLGFILVCQFILPNMAMAFDPGDLPCGGDDPYATECPIDTWLWPMVIATIGFAFYSINTANANKERIES
jgi:hypothetical protein